MLASSSPSCVWPWPFPRPWSVSAAITGVDAVGDVCAGGGGGGGVVAGGGAGAGGAGAGAGGGLGDGACEIGAALVGATGRWTTGAETCCVTSDDAGRGAGATVRGAVRAASRLVATSRCGTARAATEPTAWFTTDGSAETEVSAALGRSTSGGTISDSDSPSAAMSLAAGVRRVATMSGDAPWATQGS